MKFIHAVFFVFVVSEVHSNGVAPWLKLNNGTSIPAFGLGTWLGISKEGGRTLPQGNEVEKAVEWAIDAGYRLIDTAHIYFTEGQVGRALNKTFLEGFVKREDIFVTTKLWNDKHAREDVVPALRGSLKKLNLDYVDLYLIHWPISLHRNGTISNIDYLETWQGMTEALTQGLTKSIGVSNFNEQQLDRLISHSAVKPAVLQVEVNLNLQQPSLLAYCKSQNIKVMGYTPFGSLFHNKAEHDAPLPRTDDQTLLQIADRYNKTVPQVALRYLVELGVIPIPKSVTKSRIEKNLQVFDFNLTEQEMELLKGFDRHYRTIPARTWKDSPYYPFE